MNALALLGYLLCLNAAAIVPKCARDVYSDVVFMGFDSIGGPDVHFYNLHNFFSTILLQFAKIGSSIEIGFIRNNGYRVTVFNLTTASSTIANGLVPGDSEPASMSFWNSLLPLMNLFNRNMQRRPNVKRICVIIDEGIYDKRIDASGITRGLKDQGIILITIGIKPFANQTELSIVASKPEYHITADNYKDLLDYVDPVINLICEVSSRTADGHFDYPGCDHPGKWTT